MGNFTIASLDERVQLENVFCVFLLNIIFVRFLSCNSYRSVSDSLMSIWTIFVFRSLILHNLNYLIAHQVWGFLCVIISLLSIEYMMFIFKFLDFFFFKNNGSICWSCFKLRVYCFQQLSQKCITFYNLIKIVI